MDVVIDILRREYEPWCALLPAGVAAVLRDIDDGRSPRAARLDVESPTRVVHVTAWGSGEVDFVVGDLVTGDVLTNEHREVTSELGMRELLRDVQAAIDS